MYFTNFFFSTDIYIFQGKDYIGALQSVSIKRDNSSGSPEWFLDTVNHYAILEFTYNLREP